MTPTTLNRTRRVVGTALAAATLAAAARIIAAARAGSPGWTSDAPRAHA